MNPDSKSVAETRPPIFVSIGILAHNEAASIGRTIDSLFQQSLFSELQSRGMHAEVICVVNGSTDNTGTIVAERISAISQEHPSRENFTVRLHTLAMASKYNAWNHFMHVYSDQKALFSILMDADIYFGFRETLWNMCQSLVNVPHASVSVDHPLKDIATKKKHSIHERLSLATSRSTLSAPAQLTGQLYCIRAGIARHIRIPLQMSSCEDGFIKALVCTDFGSRPSDPTRIVQAAQATHYFDAYVSLSEILKNQKRQMMGQAFVHILVDQCLPRLSAADRSNLNPTIERFEKTDPEWLSKLMTGHLRCTRYFWRLFPGVLTFRFQRLANLPKGSRIRHLPAAVAGSCITLVACWMASRTLRRGKTNYWPEKQSPEKPNGISNDWKSPSESKQDPAYTRVPLSR